jgi:hypothetical protein
VKFFAPAILFQSARGFYCTVFSTTSAQSCQWELQDVTRYKEGKSRHSIKAQTVNANLRMLGMEWP